MSYIDDEVSPHDGEPIELYRFVGPVVTYYFTSYYKDLTREAVTYTAIPMRRSSVSVASADDPPSLEVEMPFDNPLVQSYAFAISPRSLELTIYRRHGEAGVDTVYWQGSVTSLRVEGRTAKLKVPSMFASRMEVSVPNVYYQTQCNHALYDQFCTVNRASFTQAATVSSYDGKINLVVSTVGGQPNDYFKAGELVRASDGERRLIVSQTGTSVIIGYPFKQLLPGDNVTLFAGCDHTAATCRAKFNNILNFGGHPYVPIENIFERGLK